MALQNIPSADGSLTWSCNTGLWLQSKPRQRDALEEQAGGEESSSCIPGVAGESGKSGCNDGRRRCLEVNSNSWAQGEWFSGAL